MHETSSVQVRLRAAAILPETLAASFDAFEIIRRLARHCETRAPELFAAFMTAAAVLSMAVTRSPSRRPCPCLTAMRPAARPRRAPM